MPGLRADQEALYLQDMYLAERESYKDVPTVHDRIFKVVNNVEGAGDKITQILGQGALTRHTTEDQQIVFKSPVQGWEFFVNYWMYSDGIALSKPAVEDTVKLGNLIKELANTWGKQVRIAEEQMGAGIFDDGDSTTGTWRYNGSHTGNTAPYGNLLYDNFCLFNLTGNARSTKGGGTYFNRVSGLTLTPADFETIYNLHTATNNRDERDTVVANPADTLLTKVGANAWLAKRLMNSPNLPGGELNDINPYLNLCNPVAWDYLSDTAFYVGKAQSNDWQFRKRQDPEIRFFRDETNLGYKASINIRQGVLIKNFRTWSRAG